MKTTQTEEKKSLIPVSRDVAVKIKQSIEKTQGQVIKPRSKSLPIHLIHPYSVNKESLRKIQEKLPKLLEERQRIENEIAGLREQESLIIPFLKSIEENF